MESEEFGEISPLAIKINNEMCARVVAIFNGLRDKGVINDKNNVTLDELYEMSGLFRMEKKKQPSEEKRKCEHIIAKSGNRCKSNALDGSNKCKKHGEEEKTAKKPSALLPNNRKPAPMKSFSALSKPNSGVKKITASDGNTTDDEDLRAKKDLVNKKGQESDEESTNSRDEESEESESERRPARVAAIRPKGLTRKVV